ncbi:hypothetical protein GGQ92_001070 [Gracilibacillus halotolerans]|uniref:DUF8042 domain-containing protein n=1 Tax=Gracilibacillus halotolerans TaxID=74386 RepID=A0A841RIH8_9BACI|nr:hypothetical protein [Gracilibacillus halotolerans]MBB6512289.1 hypothetical protein [Gracilibacillus halotolerans]
MKIILNDNETAVEVNPSSTEEIIKYIFQLKDEDKMISHVTIDGQAVYTNLDEYLEDKVNQIEMIQVITRSQKEFINETLVTAEEYLTNAIPELTNLVEAFYQNATQGDWDTFRDFTEGLKWLTDMIANIDHLKNRPSNWEGYVEAYRTIEEHIQSLAEAMENKDETLIADIINYEILPLYKSIKILITKTIDTEGCRLDVN